VWYNKVSSMKYSSSFLATFSIFFTTFVIAILFNVNVFYHVSKGILGAKTYTAPTTFTGKPSSPDIIHDQGAIVKRDNFSITTAPGTVPFDSYVSVGCSSSSNPISIANYWQVTPICEVFFRSQHNDAKYLSPLKSSIVSRKYTVESLRYFGVFFLPETSLKLVKSTDGGQTWTMLRNSVVDIENDTVSAITEANGAFMLMTGFVEPTTYYSYSDVKGVSTPYQPEGFTFTGFMKKLNSTISKITTSLLNTIFSFY